MSAFRDKKLLPQTAKQSTRRAQEELMIIVTRSKKDRSTFPFKNIIVFLQDPQNLDATSVCTNMHDTCKRIISKGARHPCKAKLKIYDISADEKVAPLDHFLQDNCIFHLIENHYAAHLQPECSSFCKNVGEAHEVSLTDFISSLPQSLFATEQCKCRCRGIKWSLAPG